MLEIKENVELAKYTTFRIGGPARYFTAVKNEAELLEALEYAAQKKLPHFIMGGGSNILFSDGGFGGLVIKIGSANMEINGTEIKADAGVPLSKLVREAAASGLSGMEWAAGIPGTVGGAVRGNAGAFSRTTGESVASVEVYDLEKKEKVTLKKEECIFGYRDSLFKHHPNLIILSVTFRLVPGNKDELEKQIKETIAERIGKHPQGMGSAGSYFMNPVVQDEGLKKRFEDEKGKPVRGDKLPAGWIIQEAGLKGKKIGGALISETHGDFLVNAGGATASDVIMLESYVKQQVRDEFGVQLQSEVEHVGF